MLLVRAPLSRRLAFVLYFILSAFTLTRMTDMPYKWLGLFMCMEYTAALFAATLIIASMAFGIVGIPFAVPVPAVLHGVRQGGEEGAQPHTGGGDQVGLDVAG